MEETRDLDALEIRLNKKRDELSEQKKRFAAFQQKIKVLEQTKRAQEVKSEVMEKQRALAEVQRRKSRLSLMDTLIHNDSPGKGGRKIPKLAHQSKWDQGTKILASIFNIIRSSFKA